MAYTDGVVPSDERSHARNDDPYWNESSTVTFIGPERGLQGIVYFYFRPT